MLPVRQPANPRFSTEADGELHWRLNMEQRWSLRTPVTFEVKVSYKCHPVVLGWSRNIGLEGLFIETGIMILPVGSYIQVEFSLLSASRRQQICMPAVVVHRNRNGCGIAFQAFNGNAFRAIEHVLYTPAGRQFAAMHAIL